MAAYDDEPPDEADESMMVRVDELGRRMESVRVIVPECVLGTQK
jgi:hypothetical protein